MKTPHPHLPFLAALFLGLLLCLAPVAARASFHEMQIEQVIGGVSGDVSAQAIQLRMRADGQRFLHSDDGGTFGPAALIVYDGAGANPVTLISFPNDVANGVTGDRVLIVAGNFVAHLSNALTPDFTMTSAIPASYLAAGRLDYVDGKGDVLWSLSFGGASYTGPTAPTTLNGSFGAPFPAPLPTAGTSTLLFQGAATAPGVANATDYKLTSPGAAFTNNAGATASLPAPIVSPAQVSIVAKQDEISEAGPGKATMVVTRVGGDETADLTVNYKVGGTAVAGMQFKTLSGTVVIPAGQTTAKIKIKPLDDGVADGTKTVKLTLQPGDGYSIGSAFKAKVKITDAH